MAINPQELRIGNYATSILGEKRKKVTAITTQKVKDGVVTFVTLDFEKDSFLSEHIDPVPPMNFK